MVDYIIVGAGLAGIAFCEKALSEGKTVLVFDNLSSHASSVAAGVVNPVVLKRYSGLDMAPEQLLAMRGFYERIKLENGLDCFVDMPVLRRFANIEEQNQWFVAADKPKLAPFLSTELVTNNAPEIDAPFGFGRVLQTGYVKTDVLLNGYRAMLATKACLISEAFEWSDVVFNANHVRYKGVQARHIVCAEGFGMRSNRFFSYLPLEGTKGEVLHIRTRGFSSDVIYKSGVFLLPMGGGEFKVGATYSWDDKTDDVTLAAREEISVKLRAFFKADYEIIGQKAAVRPTVKDRKPLLGTHPEWPRLHVLNGLGTRGVMLGPFMADALFAHIEQNKPLADTVTIERFRALFRPS